uniref:Ig-like domain-containing protein n=1 Tax=Buteo japonicus TaxID=224669 RepID=A0A8B9Z949_9AVES
MDFSSSFTLQCLLVIITVPHGSVTWTGVLSGGSAAFSVGNQSLQNLSRMSKRDVKCLTTVLNDSLLAKCGNSAGRCLNLQNGSLVLRSVDKEDEGKYEFVFHNTTSTFTLEVFEPAIGIQCFPNGTGELSCDVTSSKGTTIQWLLNGTELRTPEACIKDGGRKVRLDKTVPGEFVCEVYHGNSRPSILGISLSFLQVSDFGFTEEEKDDGLTMSVVSSEGVKSPPDGDHVEAQAAQIDCPSKPDAAQTGQGIEPEPPVEENLPVEIEPEEMPDPAVIIDVESQEKASDCFPDPTDD